MSIPGMEKNNKNSTYISLRVPSECKTAMRVCAALEGIPMSELSQRFLQEGLRRFAKKHPQVAEIIKNAL